MSLEPQEESIYQLATAGVLEIRPDGSIWRVGMRYGGRYAGKVFPCAPRRAEKLMPHGYLIVRARIDDVEHSTAAHRLVWRHFHGPIPTGAIVNHKNGVRTDNAPTNLELTDHAGNYAHACEVLGADNRGERNGIARLTDVLVREMRSAWESGATQDELAERFKGVPGASRSNIDRVLRRQTWGHVR